MIARSVPGAPVIQHALLNKTAVKTEIFSQWSMFYLCRITEWLRLKGHLWKSTSPAALLKAEPKQGICTY